MSACHALFLGIIGRPSVPPRGTESGALTGIFSRVLTVAPYTRTSPPSANSPPATTSLPHIHDPAHSYRTPSHGHHKCIEHILSSLVYRTPHMQSSARYSEQVPGSPSLFLPLRVLKPPSASTLWSYHNHTHRNRFAQG